MQSCERHLAKRCVSQCARQAHLVDWQIYAGWKAQKQSRKRPIGDSDNRETGTIDAYRLSQHVVPATKVVTPGLIRNGDYLRRTGEVIGRPRQAPQLRSHSQSLKTV